MNKFAYKIAQFMVGRRGFDQFSKDLSIFALVLIFLDVLLPWKADILSTLGFLIILYSYYRAFSKNLTKRHEENNWYCTFVGNKIRAWVHRDRKNFTYFKCPQCKQSLRAPKGRGKIRVTCSRCSNVFEKKV
jgi:uncharacterized C2H2 Zn-finger protein